MSTLLNEAMSAVRKMKWPNFELLIAEGFRVQGFAVSGFAAPGAPAGSDMMVEKAQKKFCVQCRDWQVSKVDVAPVQLLCKVMDEKKADGGYVITAGEVSEEAAALAAARKIQFVRGDHRPRVETHAHAHVQPYVRKCPRELRQQDGKPLAHENIRCAETHDTGSRRGVKTLGDSFHCVQDLHGVTQEILAVFGQGQAARGAV